MTTRRNFFKSLGGGLLGGMALFKGLKESKAEIVENESENGFEATSINGAFAELNENDLGPRRWYNVKYKGELTPGDEVALDDDGYVRNRYSSYFQRDDILVPERMGFVMSINEDGTASVVIQIWCGLDEGRRRLLRRL